MGVLLNDTSPETLTVTAFDATSTGYATVVVSPDGSLEYTPLASFWGADTFSYTATNEEGGESSATVTVHVAPASPWVNEVQTNAGGFTIDGEPLPERAGVTVAAGGDINGDGLDDMLLSTHDLFDWADSAERVYVVFGKADRENIDLVDIANGIGGFVLYGEFINSDL